LMNTAVEILSAKRCPIFHLTDYEPHDYWTATRQHKT